MKKFAVTDEKIVHVKKAFDRKNSSHADMRTFHVQLLEKGCQHGEEDSKNKKFVIKRVHHWSKSQDN